MVVIPVQLRKASGIFFTPFGRVTVVRAEQSAKAFLPMLVTPSGIVTEVKPVQPEKANSPMLVKPMYYYVVSL